MFSLEVGYTLEAAIREAKNRRNSFFTPEHILYALLFNPRVQEVVQGCGGSVENIRRNLEDYFEKQVDKVEASQIDVDPMKTPGIEVVLETALRHLQSSGKRELTVLDLLVSLYSLEDSFAVYFLENEHSDRLSVLEFVSHGVSRIPVAKSEDSLVSDEHEDEQAALPLKPHKKNGTPLNYTPKMLQPRRNRNCLIRQLVEILKLKGP